MTDRHPPTHGLRSETRVLPLSLTSRGRQSDREFGREITHQGACLLHRASNQLRITIVSPKLTLHLQLAARQEWPLELHNLTESGAHTELVLRAWP